MLVIRFKSEDTVKNVIKLSPCRGSTRICMGPSKENLYVLHSVHY